MDLLKRQKSFSNAKQGVATAVVLALCGWLVLMTVHVSLVVTITTIFLIACGSAFCFFGMKALFMLRRKRLFGKFFKVEPPLDIHELNIVTSTVFYELELLGNIVRETRATYNRACQQTSIEPDKTSELQKAYRVADREVDNAEHTLRTAAVCARYWGFDVAENQAFIPYTHPISTPITDEC